MGLHSQGAARGYGQQVTDQQRTGGLQHQSGLHQHFQHHPEGGEECAIGPGGLKGELPQN